MHFIENSPVRIWLTDGHPSLRKRPLSWLVPLATTCILIWAGFFWEGFWDIPLGIYILVFLFLAILNTTNINETIIDIETKTIRCNRYIFGIPVRRISEKLKSSKLVVEEIVDSPRIRFTYPVFLVSSTGKVYFTGAKFNSQSEVEGFFDEITALVHIRHQFKFKFQ